MTQACAIETNGLTKRYGAGAPAVDDLTLRVERGEIHGFVGANGAGKTTTLRMLVGLVRPTAGSASVLGWPAGTEAALTRVGAMIEEPAFYPFLSGNDNLRILARHGRVPVARVAQVLARVELSSRANDAVATYSMGMKQRLALATALLKDPALLILDEPTNGLDPAGIADIRALVRGLAREQRTVLLSSHLMHEVEQLCDRVSVIQRGRLVAEGTVAELRGKPLLRLRAEPQDRARDVVDGLPFVEASRLVDGALLVGVPPERVAEVNRQLVQAGVAVSELTPVQSSLESVFFDLVEEGTPSRG